MRLIPGKTKVQLEIFKSITIADLMVGSVLAAILIFIVTGNIPFKWVFAIIHLVISALLLAKVDTESNYLYLLNMLRHFGFGRKFDKADTDDFLIKMASEKKEDVYFDEIFKEQTVDEDGEDEKESEKNKSAKNKKNSANARDGWNDIEELAAFSEISNGFIKYKSGYYAAAFRIPDIEFRFFSDIRRDNSIENGLGAVIRMFKGDLCTNIVKIERPIEYDSYVEDVYEKIDELKRAFEHNFINEDEMKARLSVLYTRLEQLQEFQSYNRIVVPFYYLVVYDKDVNRLRSQLPYIVDTLKRGDMKPIRLDDKELTLMLKYSNGIDFDEKIINEIKPEDYAKWAMPDSVEFTPRKAIVNGVVTHNFRVVSYPITVGDAWLASILTLPSTKVVIKMQAMDNSEAIKALDRSISELRGTIATARTDSEAIDAQTHFETLQEMLVTLKNNNETLYNVNIYVTAYDITATENDPKLLKLESGSLRTPINNMKRVIKSMWGEQGFRLHNMEFMQATSYIGGQITAYDPMEKKGRGIPSNSIAACFPWIFPIVMDEKGIYLGSSDGVPVMLDFFKRDSERVNSNLVIIGKSGAGKSFSIKTVLSNLAADDAKIFVLDPEDEYTKLAENLQGQYINVATNQHGILNPFHIIASLEDENGESSGVSYTNHLQFLEEFFRQILPDCDKDSLEYLNTLINVVYKRKGIDASTDISKLRPEDYPTFDDLYDLILDKFQRSSNDYLRNMLRTLMNYVSKFSGNGRNASLWNGPSSITTDRNFTVFNFQSLLANRNTIIANAQLLLVLKYIDNEIIKNRDYNKKYNLNRKIVVVIDEAHVFIDTKFPIALDFMFQLAKRIRKYNGMQIVITQNIKDFVGSEEIARKSTAIINACQYSLIFSLSPNDMSDLCKLYEKAGGINEVEQEQIVNAPRGHAFTILSPGSRTSFDVSAHAQLRAMFKNKFTNPYFDGEGGEGNWTSEMGDSINKRNEHIRLIEEERKKEEEEAKHAVKPVIRDVYDDGDIPFEKAKDKTLKEEIILSDAVLAPEISAPKNVAEKITAVQPAKQAGDGPVTNALLSGVIDKLGEISAALTQNSANSAMPVNNSAMLLADEIRKLTEKIQGGDNVFHPADTHEEAQLQPASDSTATLPWSIFDVLDNNEAAKPEVPVDAVSASESITNIVPESGSSEAKEKFSFFDFISNETNITETESNEKGKIESFLDDNSSGAVLTVSIEDLAIFNRNVASKKDDGRSEMYA